MGEVGVDICTTDSTGSVLVDANMSLPDVVGEAESGEAVRSIKK